MIRNHMSKKKENENSAKFAIGGFVREFISPEPWLTMLDEAETKGHKIDMLLIAYQKSFDANSVKKLSEKVNLVLINAEGDEDLINRLSSIGVDSQFITNLCEFKDSEKQITEAIALNQIILYALTEGMGYLLTITDGFNFYSGVDFIEIMRKPLAQADVIATTAIPYRQDIEKILQVLQPQQLIDTFFLRDYSRFIGKVLMPDENIFKLLQPAKIAEYGNMLLNLNKITWLPPFFSQTYLWQNDKCVCTGAFENFIMHAQGRNLEILEVPIPSSITIAHKWSKWYSMLSIASRIPFFVWNMVERGMIKNRYNEIIEDFESKKEKIDLIYKEIDLGVSEEEIWQHWKKVKADLEMWILQQMATQESWQGTIEQITSLMKKDN